MTSFHEAASRWSWLTVWLSPRQAIDDILVLKSPRLVWLLASLGAIADIVEQLLSKFGFASPLLFDWRVWLGLIVGGAIFGIIGVYLCALILYRLGRWLGGTASPLELRAALSWSSLPSIAGVLVVVLLLCGWKLFDAGSLAVPGPLSISIWVIFIACNLWALATVLAMLSRVQHLGVMRTFAAYVLSFILILLFPILVRAFLFQPFSIPSSSMAPTLAPGDYVLVSKYDYGYSRYSLPFSPSFSGRVFDSPLARGDIVVFRSPKDDSSDFVKRVLGLPGDRVQMKEGALYINDVAIPRERLPDFVGGEFCGSDAGAKVKRWRETLTNGVSYVTLDCVDNGFYDNTAIYTVPTGNFFAIGDNRDNSVDSRILSAFGYVPFENIVGRVRVIYQSKVGGGTVHFEPLGPPNR